MKILWHLGLGDAIVFAPIIVKLASENDVIEIPCWKHNEVSVRSIFINYPNIIIHPFETHKSVVQWGDSNGLGIYNDKSKLNDEDFVQWIYRQAGMDFSEKEKYCPLLNASKEYNTPGGIDIFVHDDASRGFLIKDVPGMRPYCNKEESILRFSNSIMNAKEIHCIDSAFIHLAEALPTKGKLFYHKYGRPESPDYKYFKKQWTVIN